MRSIYKFIFLSSLTLSTPAMLYAAGTGKGGNLNAFLIGLVSLAVILLFAILVLGNVVRQMSFVYRDKLRDEKKAASPSAGALMMIAALFFSSGAFAQDANIASPAGSVTSGMATFDFYLVMGIIAFELLIVFVLSFQLRKLLSLISNRPVAETVIKPRIRISFWDRFNRAVSVEKEHDIMLDHNYDGIRELDNSLPPWWKYGFYLTIAISVVYIWYYHAGGNGPGSYDEYVAQVEKGEREKAAYLAKAANLVDENNVQMLDASGIASGASIFKTSCAACHANDGGGGVGPNLTDDYWLHGGSLQDIFKSIKYGWPDKGMKSWKDDFSPKQIAELTSYVKSLKGTQPLAPKEKQGEVYIEAEQIDTANKTVVLN